MKKIVFVIGWMLTLGSINISAQKTNLTLDEAVLGQSRQFAPTRMNQLTWLPGVDNYAYVKDSLLMIAGVKGKEKAWTSVSQLNRWAIGILDKPLTSLPPLHWLNEQMAWFQKGSKYYQIHFKEKKISLLSESPEDGENVDFHENTANIAFTRKNNLFVKVGGKERQLTNNKSGITSGQSVSRNEYGIEKGTFWSEQGNKLAFYQKDENQVTDYPIIDYNTTPASVNNIKYPMAGGPSELVSVGVADLEAGTMIYLDLGPSTDQFYATNLSWSPDGKYVYIMWLNRATNEARLKEFDAINGKEIKTILTEKDDKWVEPLQAIRFIPGQNEQFLYYSWKDGFHNYYLYDRSGKLLGQTRANFELKSILGFNADKSVMYVSGTGENPTEMHAYSVLLKDMSMQKLTRINGMHQVLISSNGTYLLDTYNTLSTDPNNLSSANGKKIPNATDLASTGGRFIRNLHTASDPFVSKNIGETSLFSIKGEEGTDLWCRLIRPSNFDASKKYPAIVYVYNGPHVQLVQNNWMGGSSLWMNYLAEQGFVIFTVDGRGSQNRGKSFEQNIHRQLGVLEVQDQLSGVNWLKKQSYVDPNRLGVHGWSYGGFMTTSLMLKHPGVFKVGVAGGPVIDWNLYEVMYTERYMDTPSENADGFKEATLTEHIAKLEGKLLMIHGADDDVVVMQHNMRLLKAAVDAKKQVDFFAYPGHKHNVIGPDRVHLMRKVIDYFIENL
jgi:dipeptidyl-peptidase-4